MAEPPAPVVRRAARQVCRFHTYFRDQDTSPARPLLDEHRAASREAIRERLRDGLEAGELPEGTDVDGLAAYVSAVIAGMSSRARDRATREDLAAIAEIAMRAWPVSAG